VTPLDVRDASEIEIERSIAAFARGSNDGLIVIENATTFHRHELIVMLATRHRLPSIYFSRFFVPEGGLISYAPNDSIQWRSASGYVDRILKGEKPSDLPVQQPTNFELVINLKTAKTLGLTVPNTLLAIADEVIE
jgi:putative ABC transport system substrate-binding protein